MIPAAVHIRAVLEAHEAGVPIPPETVGWLAGGLMAAKLGRPLEAALGITHRGGVGSLSRVEKMARRDELLRALVPHVAPGVTPRAAARAILNLRDRRHRAATPPASDAEDLVAALEDLDAGFPEERQLARILGTSIPH